MAPHPDPLDHAGARSPALEVAAIAQVLDSLVAVATGEGGDVAVTPTDTVAGPDAGEPLSHEVAAALDDMLARALAELGQLPPVVRPGSIGASTSAPVLGSGVLQGLIAARRRVARAGPPSAGPDAFAHLDQRL